MENDASPHFPVTASVQSRLWFIVFLSAAAALLVSAFFCPPGIVRHRWIILAAGSSGCALGIVLARRSLPRIAEWTWPVLMAASTLSIGAIILWCGMRQFGGFDHSALIDPAWRIVCGQQPFRDFPCPLPPAFYLGAAWAFELFGVQWHSLVLATALFAGGTFLWSVFLLRQLGATRRETLALGCYLQASTTVLASYWWYNVITPVTAALFLLSALLWLRRPASRLAQGSYAVSLMLLAAMKPNMAGLLIAGISVAMLLSPPHRWRAVALSGAAAAGFLLGLKLCGLQPADILDGYSGIASRGFSLEQFLQGMPWNEKVFSLAAALLATAPLAMPSAWRRPDVFQLAALTAVVAGMYGFVTNGENKLMDLPLMLLGTWFFTASSPDAPRLRPRIILLAAMLAGWGIGEALVRHRVMSIGLGSFFDFIECPEPISEGFFAGMHVSPVFAAVEKETAEAVLRANGRAIWFGPRMQWAYAAFRLTPPVYQPSWWHSGVSYAKDQESEMIENWKKHRFARLVFYFNDRTYLPGGLARCIDNDFAYAGNGKLLSIMDRRAD